MFRPPLHPCGTPAAARRHRAAGEPLDDACQAAWTARLAAHAEAKRAARLAAYGPRELTPCGTPAAARRHYRRGEPPCYACKQANRINLADRYGHQPGDGDMPDPRPVRNGIPWRPYTYRGAGYDQLTAWMDEEQVAS